MARKAELKTAGLQENRTWVSLILLAAMILCFAVVLNRTFDRRVNADDAGELILSSLLAKEHRILTLNWYYSTELRVLNTQLVFAPLFFSNCSEPVLNSYHRALLRVLNRTMLFPLRFHMPSAASASGCPEQLQRSFIQKFISNMNQVNSLFLFFIEVKA